MFQNLQGTILQTMQKNFKDMINDIKSDLVLSNLIKEDVGISLYKAKHDPVPLLDRSPVEFFMNDNQKIDHPEDSDEVSYNIENSRAVNEK